MAVETASDLAVFFSVSDWGVTAIYTPAGQASRPIPVIFDRDHLAVEIEGDVPVSSRKPRAHLRESDLVAGGTAGEAGDLRDVFVISGKSYGLADCHPDGTGVALAVLEEL